MHLYYFCMVLPILCALLCVCVCFTQKKVYKKCVKNKFTKLLKYILSGEYEVEVKDGDDVEGVVEL